MSQRCSRIFDDLIMIGVKRMGKTKAEKERSELNKKLIKKTFKQEIGQKRSFDWQQFIKTTIGIFIGMMISDRLRESADIAAPLMFAAELIIMIVCIVAVDLLQSAFGRIIRRK